MGFGHRNVLFVGVHDPHGARHLGHVANSTKDALELDLFALEYEQFLLGHATGGNVVKVNDFEFL